MLFTYIPFNFFDKIFFFFFCKLISQLQSNRCCFDCKRICHPPYSCFGFESNRNNAQPWKCYHQKVLHHAPQLPRFPRLNNQTLGPAFTSFASWWNPPKHIISFPDPVFPISPLLLLLLFYYYRFNSKGLTLLTFSQIRAFKSANKSTNYK